MKILEIGIGKYKSIGEEFIWINPNKKVNVLIGSNNSGKSNVLKGFERFTNDKFGIINNLTENEFYNRKNKNRFRFAFKVRLDETDSAMKLKDKEIILAFMFGDQNQIVWDNNPFIDVALPEVNRIFRSWQMPSPIANFQDENLTKKIASKLLASLPNKAVFIPQFRKISMSGNKTGPNFGYLPQGTGIIELLASWRSPIEGQEHLKDKFMSIQNLLRTLLDMPSLELSIPYTNDSIRITNNTLTLPLESYGTGVHELIILAIAILSEDNVLYCIEEPEIHFHPKLQKNLMSFLINNTKSQYLISTHSNAFIVPSDKTNVIHLRNQNGVTIGNCAESSSQALEILNDLGIQPSDLLQANSVIWVEGTSDRVYINKWLSIMDPDLKEGIDYSIMLYGGDTLPHLSVERDTNSDAEDLIKLLKINQTSILVFDSDKSKPGDSISKHKKRILDECQNNDLYCWMTGGREIENYLTASTISKAYQEVTGEKKDITFGTFDELDKIWASYASGKTKKARIISKYITREDINSDLEKHLKEVIKRIKRQT